MLWHFHCSSGFICHSALRQRTVHACLQLLLTSRPCLECTTAVPFLPMFYPLSGHLQIRFQSYFVSIILRLLLLRKESNIYESHINTTRARVFIQKATLETIPVTINTCEFKIDMPYMIETKKKQGSDSLRFEAEVKANVAVYLSWIKWSFSALRTINPTPPHTAFIKADPDCTCPHRQESTLALNPVSKHFQAWELATHK